MLMKKLQLKMMVRRNRITGYRQTHRQYQGGILSYSDIFNKARQPGTAIPIGPGKKSWGHNKKLMVQYIKVPRTWPKVTGK
ncbi:MAG: hypothetical protein GY940_33050 [bacterium]|nr:hypothetical protein [bacterium]